MHRKAETQQNREIKALFLDWGGVLIQNPSPGIKAYCSRKLGIPKAVLSPAMDAALPDFQTGNVTEPAFWEQVLARTDGNTSIARPLWREAFESIYRPRQSLFDLIRKWRSTGNIAGLISNTECPAMELFLERHEQAFDILVFSCMERVAKPDPAIFELACRRAGVRARESIFFDDRPEHVAGARQAGLQARLFRSTAQTETILRRCGGLY